MKTFYDVRNLPGLKKKALHQRTAGLAQAAAGRRHSPGSPAQQRRQGGRAAAGGRLLKNEQDVTLFEKLVFMQRHNR
jgi:hypothetical protein